VLCRVRVPAFGLRPFGKHGDRGGDNDVHGWGNAALPVAPGEVMNDRLSRLRRLATIKALVDANCRPALNDLDTKLEKYLGFRDGYFIECGANDGYAQSNTFYFEHMLGWKGLLVEAIPQLARKCFYIRPASAVYNCALVASGYGKREVSMRYAGLMSLVQGCRQAGDEDAWISRGLENQGIEESYEVSVQAATLTMLLDQEQPEHIHLFSLDVEGYELEVLKGLDLERYKPDYILVEAHDIEGICRHLEPCYDIVEELTPNWDYLFRARGL